MGQNHCKCFDDITFSYYGIYIKFIQLAIQLHVLVKDKIGNITAITFLQQIIETTCKCHANCKCIYNKNFPIKTSFLYINYMQKIIQFSPERRYPKGSELLYILSISGKSNSPCFILAKIDKFSTLYVFCN